MSTPKIRYTVISVQNIITSKNLLGATLYKSCQCPNAFHIDELCGKGWVSRQLGKLFQSLEASVDTVGLDPLQELTGSTRLSARKKTSPS